MLGIIVAVDAEKALILDKMSDVKSLKVFDTEFFCGQIGKAKCMVAASGIGKVNAARCTQLMIDKYCPDNIINIGSAGALHEELNIGDVVISSACMQHDVDLTALDCKKGCFSDKWDAFVVPDSRLLKLCSKIMSNMISEEFQILVRPMATGDQFCNLKNVKKAIFEEFGTYCIDMEGAAVAHVCHSCDVPFIVIRSISDRLNDVSESVYFDYRELASKRCADFLEALANEI